MKNPLATTATKSEADQKAAAYRAMNHPRQIVTHENADGTWTIFEQRCPSCDRDLAAPGVGGHKCYTYGQWHAKQAKNRAAVAQLSVFDLVTFPATAGHRKPAATGDGQIVACEDAAQLTGRVTRISDAVVTVAVEHPGGVVAFDVPGGDITGVVVNQPVSAERLLDHEGQPGHVPGHVRDRQGPRR